MSYVDNNLMSNEEIIHKANIHWFIFAPSFLLFALGFYFYNTGGEVLFYIAVIFFIRAVVVLSSTELVITSKRVIAKTGFITRSTVELSHNKVESLSVDQGLFGRMFGFGTLILNGTGGGKTFITSIDAPLVFRKKAISLIDLS